MLTIAQTARLLGVSADTLRNWDENGKLAAERTEGGHRRYSPRAIIDHLVANDSPDATEVWRKLAALGYDVPVTATVLTSGLADLATKMEGWYDAPLISLGLPEFDSAFGGGVRRGWMGLVQGKSATLKTSWAIQRAVDLAAAGENVVLFNLEMHSQSVLERIIRLHLGVPAAQVGSIIIENGPEMTKIRDLCRCLHIVDVPAEMEITPRRVDTIVRELNRTKFVDDPASVVIIDPLGALRPDRDTPKAVAASRRELYLYHCEQLFGTAKALNVLMLLVQQVPKEIPAGVPFPFDYRGGNLVTDFSDFVINLWRPEQDIALDAGDKASATGKIGCAVAKNRYGPEVGTWMQVDYKTMRLTPAVTVTHGY